MTVTDIDKAIKGIFDLLPKPSLAGIMSAHETDYALCGLGRKPGGWGRRKSQPLWILSRSPPGAS
jgi:hypothetical protein